MTHICISKLTIIGLNNGLSPGRCQAIIWTNAGILLIRTLVAWSLQAIIWTNAGILLIRTLGTNSSEILSEIHAFSFKKMHL